MEDNLQAKFVEEEKKLWAQKYKEVKDLDNKWGSIFRDFSYRFRAAKLKGGTR